MKRRTTLATILCLMAAALVGPTMVKLLEVSQELWPWWWPWPLIIGGVLFVVALLVLVPPKWWGNIRSSIISLPKWLHETYTWKRYGPLYTFGEPKVDCQIEQGGQRVIYSAQVCVSVKNRYNNCLQISVNSMNIRIEQKRKYPKPFVELELPPVANGASGIETVKGILLQPQQSGCYDIALSAAISRNPLIVLPNIHNSYCWIIRGVSIYLAGIGRRDFSKHGKTKEKTRKLIN